MPKTIHQNALVWGNVHFLSFQLSLNPPSSFPLPKITIHSPHVHLTPQLTFSLREIDLVRFVYGQKFISKVGGNGWNSIAWYSPFGSFRFEFDFQNASSCTTIEMWLDALASGVRPKRHYLKQLNKNKLGDFTQK